jgi:hypothetical protein
MAHFDPPRICGTILVEMVVFLAKETHATFRDEVCEKSSPSGLPQLNFWVP